MNDGGAARSPWVGARAGRRWDKQSEAEITTTWDITYTASCSGLAEGDRARDGWLKGAKRVELTEH